MTEKIISYVVVLLIGVIAGASIAYATTTQTLPEKQCYKSVSYQVEGDKVVETWLPANDICK